MAKNEKKPPKNMTDRPPRRPTNPAEVWFAGEALGRVLRSGGVTEEMVTGAGSDFEKLEQLLTVLPALRGTAIFDQMTEELRAFGYETLPDAGEAEAVWQRICEMLGTDGIKRTPGYPSLLWPTSPVTWAEKKKENGIYPENEAKNDDFLPAFCLDEEMRLHAFGAGDRLRALGAATGRKVDGFADLAAVLQDLLAEFLAAGGHTALHEVLPVRFVRPDPYHAEEILRRVLRDNGRGISPHDAALLQCQILRELGGQYAAHGVTMLLTAPMAGRITDGIVFAEEQVNFDTVLGVNAENALVELLDYLYEQKRLPPVQMALSPLASGALLSALAGRYPALKGAVPITFGIDGRKATEADMYDLIRVIKRAVATPAFAGLVLEPPSFITRPARRLFERAFLKYTSERCEKSHV